MKELTSRIYSSTAHIRSTLGGNKIRFGIILGSGFSDWADTLDVKSKIPYEDIPGFPTTSVVGHKGRLLLVHFDDAAVIMMQGRFHYYEGHTMTELSIPVRVFKKLGVEFLLLTNAAGGINPSYSPGDIMVIGDHINFVQKNPLIGPNMDEFGDRFPDATAIYDKEISSLIFEQAGTHQLKAHRGVYLFASGPSFETPAEIKMMRTLGADAVGMSTVPEALVANHCGIKIAGLSLITNQAAGLANHELTHDDVLQTSKGLGSKINDFLTELVWKVTENYE